MTGPCLTENELLDLVRSDADPLLVARAEPHLEACPVCRKVLADLGSEFSQATQVSIPSSPGMTLPAGTEVGRYVVHEILGRGGMGVVYSAFDPLLERKVALKVLRPYGHHTTATPTEMTVRVVDDLLREAKAMARLNHRHVVSVYDVGLLGSQVFLVMELIEGTTLREWLRAGPHPWRETALMLRDAGRGLAASHAAGLEHGDFKPENTLVGRDGVVRVSDFGVARSTALGENERGGTPPYMSPERRSGQESTPASDQFSFCVTLAEALCGERPLVGAPIRWTKEPQWLRRIVERGLRANAGERFASMDELLHELDRGLARQTQTRGAIAGAIALAALVLGGTWWAMPRPNACATGIERAPQVWNETRKQQLLRTLVAAKTPQAEALASSIAQRMDAFVSQWKDQYTRACQAFREQAGAHDLGARLTLFCLDEHVREADAFVTSLLAAVSSLDRAPEMMARVERQRSCADTRVVAALPPPPEDKRQRAEVDRIRSEVSKCVLAINFQGVSAAEVVCRGAVEAAQKIHNRPVEAEALATLGLILVWKGALNEAEQVAHQALVAAQESRHLRAAAKAQQLQFVVSTNRADFDAALAQSQLAQAAIDGLGGDEELLDMQLAHLADLYKIRGKPGDFQRAYDLHGRLLELRKRRDGPSSVYFMLSLMERSTLAYLLGRYADAQAQIRAGLTALSSSTGNRSPQIEGSLHLNLADSLIRAGKWEEAKAEIETGAPVLAQAFGEKHYVSGLVRLTRAEWHLRAGQPRQALTETESALQLIQESDEAGTHRFKALCLHGDVLLALGRKSDALAELKGAMAKRPRTSVEPFLEPDCRVTLGHAYFENGELSQARAEFEKASTFYAELASPEDTRRAGPLLELANLELKERRPSQAVSLATQALELVEREGTAEPLIRRTRDLLTRAKNAQRKSGR